MSSIISSSISNAFSFTANNGFIFGLAVGFGSFLKEAAGFLGIIFLAGFFSVFTFTTVGLALFLKRFARLCADGAVFLATVFFFGAGFLLFFGAALRDAFWGALFLTTFFVVFLGERFVVTFLLVGFFNFFRAIMSNYL